jgi:hypothetical protein
MTASGICGLPGGAARLLALYSLLRTGNAATGEHLQKDALPGQARVTGSVMAGLDPAIHVLGLVVI